MRTSESIKNIAKAMAQFQAEVKNPVNTAENPFYHSKYAPLNAVLNLVRPLLTKHGLSVLQSPSSDGEHISVTTLITHESGEWVESDPLTLKADKVSAQGAGSAVTYARRYAISAMLGISNEDDDDGNYASGTNGSEAENKKGQATEGNSGTKKNQKNSLDGAIICEGCDQIIEDDKTHTAKQIETLSRKLHGKVLCKPCQNKEAKEKKGA